MRLEINIPDTASDEVKAKISYLVGRLNTHPELVQGIDLDEDERVQAIFTPVFLAELDAADGKADAGEAYSADEVTLYLAEQRAKWKAANTA